jgi:hypothetical protein
VQQRTRLVIAGLLLAPVLALGHHSITTYDLVHATTLDGVVAGFTWENPHAHIYLDVAAQEAAQEKDAEHWTIELESPNLLRRLGWDKSTLKPGDKIVATGGRARNGSFNLRAAWIQLPDGRKLPGLPPPEN